MRPRIFSAPDATLATLLLLILALLLLRGVLVGEEGPIFADRSRLKARLHPVREVSPPTRDLHVNPNRADARRLGTLPGIGPSLAEAVIRFREAHGPFRHLSDLQGVSGIGPKRLQKMLPYLTLGEETQWSTR